MLRDAVAKNVVCIGNAHVSRLVEFDANDFVSYSFSMCCWLVLSWLVGFVVH